MTDHREGIAEQAVGSDLVITHLFAAPRALVYRTWTEPERVKRWWGPKGFTAPVAQIDLRVGGKYLFDMRSAEGKDYWSTGTYREIVPQERIVATDSFADESGQVVTASYYGMEGIWPLELQVTVTFEELGGRTKMTLRHSGIPTGRMQELTEVGWNESFDKLAQALEAEAPA